MGRLLVPIVVFFTIGVVLSNAVFDEHRQKRGASDTYFPNWPLNIPFKIDSKFTPETQQKIRQATRTFTERTCLNFNEDSSAGFNKLEYFNRVPDGGICSSPVGIRASPTQNHLVQLTLGCASSLGSIQHETMHSLGFRHTQSRHDRDNYVNVDYANIATDRHINYEKLDSSESPDYGIPFEYGSRLMYGPYEFPSTRTYMGTTMTPLDTSYLTAMGSAITLTFYDWKMINIRYNCSGLCTNTIVCQNGGYQNSRDCSRCICGDFHDGNNCEIERGLITLQPESEPVSLSIKTENVIAATSLSTSDWDNFNVEPLRVVKAPVGRRIRISIEKQNYKMEVPGHWLNPLCPRGTNTTCEYFAIEIADGDLALSGKKFCCYENEYIFVSKSNAVGYRAFSHRGVKFEGIVKFSLEPEANPPAATTTEPASTTTSPLPPSPDPTTVPPTTEPPATTTTTVATTTEAPTEPTTTTAPPTEIAATTAEATTTTSETPAITEPTPIGPIEGIDVCEY